MKTELTRLPSLLLGGVGFYGDPFSAKSGWDAQNEIGRTWERFTAFLAENPERPYSAAGNCMYELHIFGGDTAKKGYYEIFVGEEVNTANLPVCLCAKFIPAADYLKVTLSGSEITGDWWYTLDQVLLPDSGFRKNPAFIIEAYDARFKGMAHLEDSEIDVFIPLIKHGHDDI